MDIVTQALARLLPCFPSLYTPNVSIHGKKYHIERLLGEGAYSYVYLVSEASNPLAKFALKKIKCSFGTNDESYRTGQRELYNYARFKRASSPYIILPIDQIVINEPDGEISIYIVLPYFEMSLQDRINNNVLNKIYFDERQIITLFIGVCRGIKVIHLYQASTEEEEETDTAAISESDVLLGQEQYDDVSMHDISVTPYSHFDIKPANIMISREGLAVLVDMGSCSRARMSISNRQEALSLTDFALQHCTLPFRAPELLDIQTNSILTEKVDIWSLGCVLYNCCFGCSPFEKLEQDEGASLSLAIAQGRIIIPPDEGGYSADLISIIHDCIQLDPTQRPTILQVLERMISLSSL